MKNFLAYSLQRLGVDYIDLYRPARLDTSLPIEETIGGIADIPGRSGSNRSGAATPCSLRYTLPGHRDDKSR